MSGPGVFTRTWRYGTRFAVRVDAVAGEVVTAFHRVTGEGFLLVGGGHAIEPEPGKHYVIEFTEGGPTGGFWRILMEVPS